MIKLANSQVVRVESADAYIIHQRRYGETSVIIEVFTRVYGRMSLIVKGFNNKKGKSNRGQLLQSFTPLLLSWSGKSDLKTLTQCEPNAATRLSKLVGIRLFSALYLNELIYYLFKPVDPAPLLFDQYQHCLQALASEPIEIVLREFELQLLREVGFGIDLLTESNGEAIQPVAYYNFIPSHGFKQCTDIIEGQARFQGEDLIAINRSDWQNPSVLNCAKRLLRPLIQQLLNGRELKSRQFFYRLPQQKQS